ncbi:MAG: flippase-like domain-containing protein [Anaerolineaceae bacterium]|nr:flippase-like domain-containing protein [Anaerolineaceae bacterium]
MSQEGGTFWQDARRWLPGVLISLVALFVLFKLASWPDLLAALSSFLSPNLLVAVLLSVVSLATRAFAWKTLLGNVPKFSQSFFIINEGYLLNNIFPLRAGEFARAIFMGQASGLGPYHVLSTIVLERAFDLAMAAGLVLVSLPLALGMEWARPIAVAALVLVIAGLILLFLMARYNEVVRSWMEKLGARWPVVQKIVLPRLGALMDGLEVLTKPARFIIALIWIVLSWVIWVSTHYVMLLVIRPGAPFWWAMFADGMLALGVAIPSAPAALGVFEGVLAGALTLLGVSLNTAIAYAIVMHFLSFFSTGIFGFWGLLRERRSISSLFSQMRWKNKNIVPSTYSNVE